VCVVTASTGLACKISTPLDARRRRIVRSQRAGFARYKEWMARGLERVQDLGPVLGPLHPVVAENTTLLNRCRASTKSPFT